MSNTTRIHYASGHVVELRPGEGARFWNRGRNAGFRYYQTLDNIVIPFNHPTITYIELEGVDRPTQPQPKPTEQVVANVPEIKEAEQTQRQTAEEIFMAKANCTHKDHNGQTLRKLKYTDTVNGRKYFPVCEFCGHRERYIGVPKIEAGDHPLYTMDDVRDAQPYEA